MTDDTSTEGKQTKGLSTIGFPYLDIDDAILVAKAIHDAGGVPLDRDQLAAQMGQKPGTGNFSIKLGAGRLFGLIENVQNKYQLTSLGYEILDPAREKRAKVDAFLNVPLYRRAYDEFKGKTLPPRPYGLENAFVGFGVAPKQKDKARHAFDRSARSAGFFPNGQEDRLVMPVVGASQEPPSPTAPAQSDASPAAAVPVRPSLDPFVEGLLDRLPASKPLPEKAEWPVAARAKWLQAAAQIFDLIYEGDDGQISVVFTPTNKAIDPANLL